MKRTGFAAAVALAIAAPLGGPAHAEEVIVIDAPDLQKLGKEYRGKGLRELIGQDVYSNAWKQIGEITDFILTEGGHFYAVVDIDEGPLKQHVKLGEDDTVVVPWDQLRVASRPE